MPIGSWLITALVVALLVTFVGHLLSLRHLPTAQRPRTGVYDRYGEILGARENPDYHVSPGEDHADDPAQGGTMNCQP